LRRFVYHFVIAVWRAKEAESNRVKYLEIIADNLKKAGWSLGYVSAIDSNGRTIWIADAHHNGKRFVVSAEEKMTAVLGLAAGSEIKIRCTSRRPSRTENRSAYRGKTTNS